MALRVGFIGGGKIAQAMAKGFIGGGLTKGEHIVASTLPTDVHCIDAFRSLGAQLCVENTAVVRQSDVVFVSVKPSVVEHALTEVRQTSGGKLFISVAMGITLDQLQRHLAVDARVIRVMTNTPALVRSASSVFVRGKTATPKDAEVASSFLRAIGTCEEVSESMMDPVTALSGSGPAYVFVMIEALADGAVKMGLPRDLATSMATQTVLGAALLLKETQQSPSQLRNDVTSPAGSTASGLHVLEQHAFRGAIIGAVEAATERCKQISTSSK